MTVTENDTTPADGTRSTPVVAVTDVTRMFAGPPPVTALQPCTFEIWPGEFVAVTGPSGSGKSTLLSVLGLLDAPTSGRYVLDGYDTAGMSDNERSAMRARRLGFVFQAFHLVGYRSVLDNVELGLLYQGVGRRERRTRAEEMVERVGLTARQDALCAHLSGGEKQRVAIARTLIRRPAVVLCDEPTGNLDTVNSDAILSTLHELHHEGLTIIVITHDPDIARQAQRHLQIRDGVVTEVT